MGPRGPTTEDADVLALEGLCQAGAHCRGAQHEDAGDLVNERHARAARACEGRGQKPTTGASSKGFFIARTKASMARGDKEDLQTRCCLRERKRSDCRGTVVHLVFNEGVVEGSLWY